MNRSFFPIMQSSAALLRNSAADPQTDFRFIQLMLDTASDLEAEAEAINRKCHSLGRSQAAFYPSLEGHLVTVPATSGWPFAEETGSDKVRLRQPARWNKSSADPNAVPRSPAGGTSQSTSARQPVCRMFGLGRVRSRVLVFTTAVANSAADGG
jgi:hypothetical protein